MPILLRTDFNASQVRAAAKATKNGPQVRCLGTVARLGVRRPVGYFRVALVGFQGVDPGGAAGGYLV